MTKSKTYYKLSHKREGMKDYKGGILAYDPFKILIHKIRLERRLKVWYNYIMKNAVLYKGSWLMPNSTAKELYDTYRKSNDNKDRKKLDDHMKVVEQNYKNLCG